MRPIGRLSRFVRRLVCRFCRMDWIRGGEAGGGATHWRLRWAGGVVREVPGGEHGRRGVRSGRGQCQGVPPSSVHRHRNRRLPRSRRRLGARGGSWSHCIQGIRPSQEKGMLYSP